MIKKFLLTPALLSLTLAVGCAKGGNGMGNGIVITVSDGGIPAIYVTSSVTFTAKVTGTSNTAVAWTLVGTACTGTPNPCGTIDVNTGVFQAPANPPSPTAISIIATSKADSTASGSLGVHVVPVTVFVAPAVTPAVNVGHGLVQQFTAVAVPDNAPQTFTWTCTVGGAACANFVSNSSGLAIYTAAESACGNGCVTLSAVSKIDPTGCAIAKDCTAAKVSVVTSRVSGMYAFRFSGFDSAHHPADIAGSVTFTSDGAVADGVEDVVINTGSGSSPHQYTIASGSYAASTAGDGNSNNAGTLTLVASGGPTHTYSAVLDSFGNLRLIESDSNGTGSGTMERSAASQFNTAAQNFVFGFTGTDANGNRVGYVGLLPLDGSGHIKSSGGIADTNDNGTTTSACAAPPCSVTGTYTYAGGIGTMQLVLGGQLLNFDFYVGSGQTKNATGPLTIYAISTDTVGSNNPALSGRMVFQDPGTVYDQTALNADSVSHLTGVDNTGTNTLVSLVAATGQGNGNLTATFDANNAGTIVAAATQAAACTYTTDSSKTGRYVVTLLGTGSSCTGGLPVVLYASGADRGFLLDQSSAAVMTGAMDPQNGNGSFASSELPGTFALGTAGGATIGVAPMVANWLLTSPGNAVFSVAGTQYAGPKMVTGTYNLMLSGTGTATLTSPVANYVIYATDTSHFEMIDVDKTVTNAAVIFAQE